MTVIDLRGAAIEPASCYERFIDPTLPHQLKLRYGKGRVTIVASCNCGVQIDERRPEVPGSLDATLGAYALHVAWVCS